MQRQRRFAIQSIEARNFYGDLHRKWQRKPLCFSASWKSNTVFHAKSEVELFFTATSAAVMRQNL